MITNLLVQYWKGCVEGEINTEFVFVNANTTRKAMETKAWEAKRRAAGICVTCRNKAVPGRSRCADHLRKARIYWHEKGKQK